MDRGYFILLIHPDQVSGVLQLSASEVISWNEIMTPILHLKKPEKIVISEISGPENGINKQIELPPNGTNKQVEVHTNGIHSLPVTPSEPKRKKNKQLFPPDNFDAHSAPPSPKKVSNREHELEISITKIKKSLKDKEQENLVASKWVPLLKALRGLLLAKKVESVHFSTLATWKNFSYKELGYSKLKLCLEDAKSEQLIHISDDDEVSMLQKGWKILKKNKASKDSNPPTPSSKEEKTKSSSSKEEKTKPHLPTPKQLESASASSSSSSSVINPPKKKKKEKKETKASDSSQSSLQMEEDSDESTSSSSFPSLNSSNSLTNESLSTIPSLNKKSFGSDFNFVLYYLVLWKKS